MLEIIILTIVIVLAFIAASWYSYKRSQERAAEFEKELEQNTEHGDEAFQQRFDSLFEQELQHQDDETDKVTISTANQSDSSVAHTPDMFSAHVDDDRETLFTEDTVAPVEKTALDQYAETEPAISEQIDDIVETVDETPLEQDVNDWDMVIALTIMAPESNLFTGRAVKAALEHHQCHFGEMQIYHRFNDDAHKQALFSIANIIDPGTLLPDAFVSMKTPGLLVFARLPGPVSGMALFDELLETAIGISNELGGILCNDVREPIEQHAIEEMRSRILNYQMSLQTEKNQHADDYVD